MHIETEYCCMFLVTGNSELSSNPTGLYVAYTPAPANSNRNLDKNTWNIEFTVYVRATLAKILRSTIAIIEVIIPTLAPQIITSPPFIIIH